MRRVVGFWPLAVTLGFLLPNFMPRLAGCPETFSDVWDAPYAVDPKLLESIENDEFRSVQYGFPLVAYEHWWHRDNLSRVESAVTLGAFGNLACLIFLLIIPWRILRCLNECIHEFRDELSRQQA